MWGKASWGTSAARWGAVAVVSGVVAVSTVPAGVQANATFGARSAAVATPSPASVMAGAQTASGSLGYVVESASIVAAAAAPVGRATGGGSQPAAIQAATTAVGRTTASTIRLDAASSAMVPTARATTTAPQLSAALASITTNHLTGVPALSTELARAAMVAAGQTAALGGAQVATARAAKSTAAATAARASATELARGDTTAVAQADLGVLQLEIADADAVFGDFLGPQGVTVENATAAALAVGRATAAVAQAMPTTASMAVLGFGATNAIRTDAARGATETAAQVGASAAQLAAITAATAFADLSGLPVFSVESATAAAVRTGMAAVFGPSTHAAIGADLFGSTPNQFSDSIETADAFGAYELIANLHALTEAAAQGAATSAGTAQTAASDVLNVVFVTDAWPAGAEFFASIIAAARAADFVSEGAGQFGTSTTLARALAVYDPLRLVSATSVETAFITALMSSTSLKAPAFVGTVKRRVSPILIGRTS